MCIYTIVFLTVPVIKVISVVINLDIIKDVLLPLENTYLCTYGPENAAFVSAVTVSWHDADF